jgi:hypothetical protein
MQTRIIKCIDCGKEIAITAPIEQWHQFELGTLAQNAFPKLTAEQREMLISRTCDDCWDKIFADQDDDEIEMGYEL